MERDALFYRRELDRILLRYRFISRHVEDFWLFAKKYQAVIKKAKSTPEKRSNSLYKELLGKVQLNDDERDLFENLESRNDRRIPGNVQTDFKTILLAYLSFKKKQTAEQLEKLKESKQALPVYQFRDKIIEAVRSERVVIVAGDTGCGKSTQVPQYLVEAGFKRIACTQPRRIACISLSKRVAFETQTESTSEIGYQIRFEKKRNDETKILFITEGLLLRQVSSGDLSEYDVVILDEVHERHLQGDFLLGVLRCLIVGRPDLKLVLMSATINLELFANYFSDFDPALISVPGRLYPIQINYQPPGIEEVPLKNDRIDPTPYLKILQLIDQKYQSNERGDVLIFVSGMNEITTLTEAATAYNEKIKRWIILPLHSSLSLSDQDKVFDYPPEGFRKCIVSTNIAETSLTIDGIRFVIDSGKVKEMSYDAVCKMQRLKEFWVSKASADQRKGRAGRSGPGVCYRLYSEADYLALSEFTTPEIQRVPLDSVLLQMISMGLPDSRKFPFLEPPHPDALESAILSLKTHACLTEDEKLTSLGKMLSMLPVDIALGKVLIMGSMFHQVDAALSLASALSVQSVYTHRAFRDHDTQMAREELESDHGDPVTLLNILKEWLRVKRDGGATRRWAKVRGLEEQRLYDMIKLRTQFKDLLQESGLLNEAAKEGEELTSADRALRHGELKILKQLKRSHQSQEGNTKRKKLKPDSWTLVSADDVESSSVDIRDIDFRLTNDRSKLEGLVGGCSTSSYRDLMMLKVILLCGLYPQLAIPDEFNHCKGVNEQLFHTKTKPFVFLHPVSVLGNKAQILQLEESDIIHAVGFPTRNPLSTRHQALLYMSLLETNKPYLVNTLRLPALQSFLLTSSQIHTNSDFTVLICDSWVKFRFPRPEPIEKLLLSVVRLRASWDRLITSRIEEKDGSTIEAALSEGLLKLMQSDIAYSYKRLLPADLKGIYLQESCSPNSFTGPNPLLNDFPMEADVTLGGVRLTPYLTHNCLIEGSDAVVEMWQCDMCDLRAPLPTLERLQHMTTCSSSHQTQTDVDSERCSNAVRKANAVAFSCSVCQKELYLSPIEILKHKKQCLSSAS